MPDKIAQALVGAAARLAATSETPRLDAEILMAHALGLDRGELLLRQHDLLPPLAFAGLVERRAFHEPIAYITGEQHFWNLRLSVTPDVLIPRADSESLIEAALEHFSSRQKPRSILDLGTGSGALVLAALSEFAGAYGTAIDASAGALKVAEVNAIANGLAGRARCRQLSWHAPDWISALGQTFDLILCNPPYVEIGAKLAPTVQDFEPAAALFAEGDGLSEYRHLIPLVPQLLTANGAAIFEVGAGQEKAVREIAANVGFLTSVRDDLNGIARAVVLSLKAP